MVVWVAGSAILFAVSGAGESKSYLRRVQQVQDSPAAPDHPSSWKHVWNSQKAARIQFQLAEISGSGTIIHTANSIFKLVLNLAGVHAYKTDAMIKVYVPLHKLFIFDQDKYLIKAPGGGQ